MYDRVQEILANLMDNRIEYMSAIVEMIADQKDFQDAIIASDRAALLEKSNYLLESVSNHQKITHLYFHDNEGNMVLRVYRPEDLSEASHKYIMQKAMTEKVTVSGLEIGKSGTFTLRVIYPWVIEGELAGYIEIGNEIDSILRDLKNIANVEFMIIMDKKFLDQGRWEAGMEMLGRTPNWSLMPDKVLVESSLPISDAQALKYIYASPENGKISNVLKIDSSVNRVSSFPLKDVAGRSIGGFILIKDITDAIVSSRNFVIKVTFFSMLLCSAIFIFTFKVLGRTDRELNESASKLRSELISKEQTARELANEVSFRLKAEDDLRKLNENLEHHVQKRTSELHSANVALEEAYKDLRKHHETIIMQDKMACLGQLAAGIAHDINNPIGFVYGNLEVLEGYWDKVLRFIDGYEETLANSGTQELLSDMKEKHSKLKIDYVSGEIPVIMSECLEGIERVKRIVLNLKGFSSIDDNTEHADINACVESTINIVQNEFRHKAVIKREYGDIPKLLCKQQQINQVIMNLLINASQAIDDHGEVNVRTWSSADRIFISIQDNGCGIPKESLDKIFEPFYTTKKAGTGLGLSIVCEIIKGHGGDISVESEPGNTLITMSFPLMGNNNG
jgi:signal transduction histidine kinase